MPYLFGILAAAILVSLFVLLRSRGAGGDATTADRSKEMSPQQARRPVQRPTGKVAPPEVSPEGTRAPEVSPEGTRAPEVSPEGTRGSWLVVIQGPEKGRAYLLGDRSVTMGRATTNFIQLSDLETSRIHCQVRATGFGYEVVDMSSAGGTFLDGNRIGTGNLVDGTRISIGNTVLLFEKDASHTRDHTVERKATSTIFGVSTELPEDFGRAEGDGKGLIQHFTELGRLTKMARTNISRAEFLQAMSMAIASHTDWDRVAYLGEEAGAGWRVESFHHRARLEVSRGKLPPDKGLMIRALETGEQHQADPSSLDSKGLGGALAIPVKRGDEVVGVAYMDRLTPRARPPSPDEIEFLRAAVEIILELPDP